MMAKRTKRGAWGAKWVAAGVMWGGAVVAVAGQKVLVAGDSLTKEYRSEFVGLYPGNPAAWGARNWIEILDARRNDFFDLGSWEVFADWRLTGHEYNWAKPGGTAREFRNFLRLGSQAELETTTSAAGQLAWEAYPTWRNTLTAKAGTADKVVLFFGGNDLALGNTDPMTNPVYGAGTKQVDYESIYAGTFGAASDPGLLESSIRQNVQSIMQWFRVPRTVSGQLVARFTGPMILCAVPHVGATPKVQAEAGTDPVRTKVITDMLDQLNGDLKAIAATMDVGFADIYSVTKRVMEPGLFDIGGVIFNKGADADCRVRYLFSGDGFHPNTALQAKVAQVVVDAFLENYPWMAPDLKRMSDRGIIKDVLELPIDTGYEEWMVAEGVASSKRGPLDDPDGDGVPNVMEYALAGGRPGVRDEGTGISVTREYDPGGSGEVLRVDWKPRFVENAYLDLVPEVSGDLRVWETVASSRVIRQADGGLRLLIQLSGKDVIYFRLRAVVAG